MNNELLFVLIVTMLFSKNLQSDLKKGAFFALFFIIGILPLILTIIPMSKAHYGKEIIGLDLIFTNDDETNSPTSPEPKPPQS
jgi:hypothetical protein